jgi:hypothetical protein
MWGYNYIRRDVKMKRISYEEVRVFFEKSGCILLSTEYKNNKQKLEFQCKCGNKDFKIYKEFKKHPFCSECNQFKISIDDVRNYIESYNCKLLSNEYKNNRQILKLQCHCGDYFEKSYDNFRNHPQCKKCGYEIQAKKTSYSYEEVFDIFLNGNCLLLESKYKNSKQILKYLCECGEISYITLTPFINGTRCKNCGFTKSANSNRHTYEYVKSIFENRNCILLSNEYINNKTKLHYICSCGNEDWSTFDSFVSNKETCEKCANKRKSEFHKNEMVYVRGEEHPNWDHSKTIEEREKNRWLSEQKVWRKQVYKRDNYTCQCCGDNKGGNLVSHHLDGYDWCKESRWDIENGITLCVECHSDFHHIYGYGLNTKEQFEEYMEGISWNCKGIYDNLVI